MRNANTGTLGIASQKAGMSRTSGTKYFKAGGRICKKESTRIYPDAFAEVWDEIEKMLKANPGLQAKTLLNWLIKTYPEKQFTWSQLRTLQRRIEEWRYLKGPNKEVMFRQELYPGKQSQSDWTNCNDLKVTIQKKAHPHLLFRYMLPYSRWEAVNQSKSESFESLTYGVMNHEKLPKLNHEKLPPDITNEIHFH